MSTPRVAAMSALADAMAIPIHTHASTTEVVLQESGDNQTAGGISIDARVDTIAPTARRQARELER